MTSWKTTRESCAELGALWGTGMSHSWYNPSSSLKLDSLHNCLCCTLQWIVSVSRVMRKTPWLHKAFILLAIYTTAHYVKKQFKHNCIYKYMFRYHYVYVPRILLSVKQKHMSVTLNAIVIHYLNCSKTSGMCFKFHCWAVACRSTHIILSFNYPLWSMVFSRKREICV